MMLPCKGLIKTKILVRQDVVENLGVSTNLEKHSKIFLSDTFHSKFVIIVS